MKSKRVLYISQEVTPYLPETEISALCRHLPQAIQEMGNEIRLFMPRFGVINERRNQLHEVKRLSGGNMEINNRDHHTIVKVASIQAARMQVYFIDNEDFFKEKVVFGHDSNQGNINDERSIFFVRGALEVTKKLGWHPDIIHCHGWFTALAALYLKSFYKDEPIFRKAKIVISVYNNAEPSDMPETLFEKLKFNKIKPSLYKMMEGKTDYTALMKMAIQHAHGVIQGSEEIDPELIEFIQSNEKPFLPYQGAEGYAEAYNAFYDTL